LILAGANARAADSHGVTPLSIAALNGNAEMVKLLLDAGADARATLLGGETVLMTAARTGSLEAVKALVEAGADVNAAEPRRGQTALLWAAVEGHADVVDYLIGRGANFKTRLGSGFTPFLLAAREGKREVLEVLLRAGVDVNEYTEIPPKSARVPGGPRPGTTALHLAVTAGHFELAAWLLDQGANPNADLNGWTALHAITGVRKPGGGDNDPAPYGSGRMTSLELVRKLKDKGADLNARMTRKINVGLTSLNTLGATPFLLAARSADFELMRELARLGADPLIPNQDGATPLIVAAGLGTRSPGEDAGTEEEVVEAIRVALELGNDIHAVDDNGETAMHGAAYKNCGAAVRFLAERGMKPSVWNQPNKAGWTPLDIAMGYRFGNFKPSPPTEAAIREIAAKVGVVPLQSSSKNKSSY
jgi:ankyrin repeat protein